VTGASRPPVSAYVRTLNEASRIEACVISALAAAREVVVVDSGSTDDTVALARSAGARVVERRWQGNGAQKRIAEDACGHDWLLDLDADEVVSEALAGEISALFARGEPSARAYTVPLVHASPLPGGRPVGRVRKLKLYDRRATRAPDSRLDSNVPPPAGSETGRLNGTIHHAMFEDAADLMAKMNRRSTRNTTLGRARPVGVLRLRILFGLPFYVLKNLGPRRMALGGTYGFATATMLAFGRWLRDVKTYEAARGLRSEGEET
jgi:glycosyltransferase involved in cell wall biosynthesis